MSETPPLGPLILQSIASEQPKSQTLRSTDTGVVENDRVYGGIVDKSVIASLLGRMFFSFLGHFNVALELDRKASELVNNQRETFSFTSGSNV